MDTFRRAVIRLANDVPSLRMHLIPLLERTAAMPVAPDIEAVIRDKELNELSHRLTEKLSVFDQDGHLILEKEGHEKGVDLDSQDMARISGHIMTHNHPGALSLSLGDALMASQMHLRQVRAVLRTQIPGAPDLVEVVSLHPRDGQPWPSTLTIDQIFSKHNSAVMDELDAEKASGKLDRAGARRVLDHRTWVRAAPELGLEYHRIAIS